jgi:hypothetical protein
VAWIVEGLVRSRRDAKMVRYSLTALGQAALSALAAFARTAAAVASD